jgi:hypothetical protein
MFSLRGIAISVVLVVATALICLSPAANVSAMKAENANRVFEIRTYTTEDGKLDALLARFRDHTVQLFNKHGMTSIGYWVPQDEPKSKNTLIYIIAHESREAAKKNWADFMNDPEWQTAKAESEAQGKLVNHVESIYADPADFSPLK